jgi:hypothetical protein
MYGGVAGEEGRLSPYADSLRDGSLQQRVQFLHRVRYRRKSRLFSTPEQY